MKKYLVIVHPEEKRVDFNSKKEAIKYAKKELKEMDDESIDWSSVEVYECNWDGKKYQKELIFEDR